MKLSIALTALVFVLPSQIHLVLSNTVEAAHNAVLENNLDSLTKILEENPRDLSLTDENGWTLMHEAVRANRKDSVALLINAGADLNLVNKQGKKPLDLAKEYHPDDQVLYEYVETHTNSARYNAVNGHVHALQSAQEHGRLNEPDSNGWTAVHEAARAGRLDSLDFLKTVEGVDADAENNEGQTALQVAQISHPDDHPIHKLLQTWSNGVHKAAASGDLKFLEEVSKAEPSKLHIEDHFGWSPIHEAVRGGHLDVVELLLTNGADGTKTTASGHRPLDIARSNHGEDHAICAVLKEL